jgi:hypothetical protein
MSKVKCFNYLKIDHFARDCTKKRKTFRGRHHASTADVDDQSQKKRKESKLNEMVDHIKKQYYLIYALSSFITCSSETWLIDSGTSRHMTGY